MNEEIIKSIVKWLGTQTFNNILILLVLFILSWLAYNLVSTTLPSIHHEARSYHKELLETAERERALIRKTMGEERDTILKNAEKEREKLSMMYDRWIHLLTSALKDRESIVADKDKNQ